MRKLLVLMVALVTVAAFAAVSISGSASAQLKLVYDASTTPATVTPSITSSGSIGFKATGTAGELAGFEVTISGPVLSLTPTSTTVTCDEATVTVLTDVSGSVGFVVSGYAWQYLYKTDALSVRYLLGTLSRGTAKLSNSGGALALEFAMTSGDLKDTLKVYGYFPGTPMVDLDVLNNLSFGFVGLDVFAQGLVKAGAAGFPLLGVDATLDIAKALNIEGATLSGYANLKIDPNASGMDMLPAYKFGVNWGIDKFSGNVWFDGPKTLGASVSTTILSPVTLSGSVSFPVDLSDFSAVTLSASASWVSELLSHTISLTFQQPTATITWAVSVSF